MNKKIINMLFSDMCCSECKADFTDDSVFVLRKEKNLTVIQVICQHCGKSFGIALLGGCEEKKVKTPSRDDMALQIQEGPDAIVIATKIDLTPKSKLQAKINELKKVTQREVLPFSTVNKRYNDNIIKYLEQAVL